MKRTLTAVTAALALTLVGCGGPGGDPTNPSGGPEAEGDPFGSSVDANGIMVTVEKSGTAKISECTYDIGCENLMAFTVTMKNTTDASYDARGAMITYVRNTDGDGNSLLDGPEYGPCFCILSPGEERTWEEGAALPSSDDNITLIYGLAEGEITYQG